MTYCYRYLNDEDRAAIMLMRGSHSIRTIAIHLVRTPSTESWMLARHTADPINDDDAGLASFRDCLTRHRPRQSPKLNPVGEFFAMVVHLLRKVWSPEQIARALKHLSLNDSLRQVLHVVICNLQRALRDAPRQPQEGAHRLPAAGQ